MQEIVFSAKNVFSIVLTAQVTRIASYVIDFLLVEYCKKNCSK